ncbi:MAG: LysE family translocator [Flavobacteriales bacterium]
MEYLEVIFSATLLSLILSFVLIGPVFFLMIETSITKGIRAALALDLGVIVADLVYIFVCYYGSKEVSKYLTAHPESLAIGGLVILVFGLFQVISKGNLHFKNNVHVGSNYLSMFFKGFILNFVNIGILIFWLATVIIVNASYHHEIYKITTFFSVLLGVFLAIDILKIFLARKFKDHLTDQMIYKLKKVIGSILVIIGVYLIFRGFGEVNIEHEIDKHPLQQIESIQYP